MNALDKVKELIKKDGGEVIRADLFGDVLIIVVTHASAPQIENFQKIGNKLGMFENSEIEIKEKGLVFSAALSLQKAS